MRKAARVAGSLMTLTTMAVAGSLGVIASLATGVVLVVVFVAWAIKAAFEDGLEPKANQLVEDETMKRGAGQERFVSFELVAGPWDGQMVRMPRDANVVNVALPVSERAEVIVPHRPDFFPTRRVACYQRIEGAPRRMMHVGYGEG
jgi:hypothetical protein